MNVLAEQLAELLNIGIEQAIKLYPVLRTQFVWYEILTLISLNGIGIGVVIAVVSFVLWADSNFNPTVSAWVNKEEVMKIIYEHNRRKGKLKRLRWVGLTILVVGILLISIRPIFAPDLMLIQKILGG